MPEVATAMEQQIAEKTARQVIPFHVENHLEVALRTLHRFCRSLVLNNTRSEL
jgi:hypothetical protein